MRFAYILNIVLVGFDAPVDCCI